ncbi:MAG: amidase [Acetobacteraceae bacterium]|nr:amidase [Acetobacteraceae bacterium]
MRSIPEAIAALDAGQTTARALVEDCLARIVDPAGEGARAFVTVYADQARAGADAMDLLRRAGRLPSPLAGIPISLKALFDVAGERTHAGSQALDDAPPAQAHAAAVARLLGAGMVPVGRTSMTEFAFSGLGINPQFGTPRAPWDRDTGRIPGGSSSGAAVSVADGMALMGLGTDTGGSCRIPAAFCGIVGYKPTARRVPLAGAVPLSPSLDSIGPLAADVASCALVHAVLAGEAPRQPEPFPQIFPLGGLRLAVPEGPLLEGMDSAVAAAFDRALGLLGRAGAHIAHVRFPQFAEIAEANRMGGFAAAEAFAWHRALLDRRWDDYDPRIRKRIAMGGAMSAADVLDLLAARPRIRASMDQATLPFDALALPTVPIVPPPLADLEDEAEYGRVNALVLRNTSPANFLDRCAISLPMHREGEPPAGLMLMGETGGDARLFGVAAAVEKAIRA